MIVYLQDSFGLGLCRATPGAAGYDVRAAVGVVLAPGEKFLMPTGLRLKASTPGIAMVLLPRSGLSHTHGVILGNTVGLIDPDYRGEIKVSLHNTSRTSFTITAGDRIAQAIFIPVEHPTFCGDIVTDDTPRGEGGFGHTGGFDSSGVTK